jgi:hypothetical protein
MSVQRELTSTVAAHLVDGGQQVGVARRHDAVQQPVTVARCQHAVDHDVAAHGVRVVQASLTDGGNLQMYQGARSIESTNGEESKLKALSVPGSSHLLQHLQQYAEHKRSLPALA